MKFSFSQNRSKVSKLIKARLLLALTNVDRLPLVKSRVRKIIILRYDRIGDLIVSLPFISLLKEIFPHSETTILASEVNAPIAAQLKFIDRTLVKNTNFFFWILQLLKLRNEKPDLIVDLNHSVAPHTILAALILKSQHVATPFKDGRWGVKGTSLKLFDIMPTQHHLKYARPIAETYLDIALALGCQPPKTFGYPLPQFTRPSHIKEKFLVLNPRGSRSTMHLKETDLVSIAKNVALLAPTHRIIVPAMAENYNYYRSLFSSTNNVIVAAPNPTIIPTLALIQHAELVITPDTAIVHIACAYSVKLVAVYTSDVSLFEQWKPINNADTHIIRSSEPKSLKGYSSLKLLDAVKSSLTA